jgi:predicted phosphodiesterase
VRIAVVSDIHANGDALEAVAAEIARLGPDRVLHLGDVAGYNAEPEKCVRWVMEHAPTGVLGNHDAVVTGRAGGEGFHGAALLAARWSAGRLSRESLDYLAALPERTVVEEGFLLVHGAPSDPDRYLFFPEDAAMELRRMRASGEGGPDVVFFGHTHVPGAFVLTREGRVASVPPRSFTLSEGERILINPGSVGQPRDRDPRASFVLFDTESREATWVRVPYDVEAARRKVLAAGLPSFFAARLADGA